MLYNKIVLAGGSGYLGSVLARYYAPICKEVVILSRKPANAMGNVRTAVWDAQNQGEWTQELENAGLLINLCGKNVNCRYTAANRRHILQSRILPTAALGKAIATLANPPLLWINVTSATIYRHAEDGPQDEERGELGSGFSVEVCKEWEACFFDAHTPATRKVALRMGIVLGLADGAFPRLLNLVKLGMGGRQGSGNQYVSWVHEQDAARCTEWLLKSPAIEGAVNCTAPNPITNNAFMYLIRRAAGVPFGLPTPAWLLALGARIIGTETELILKSRWVYPGRLLQQGYRFLFPEPEPAIRDIVQSTY